MPSDSLRLVDANVNRASEGLRVLEDLARFVANNQMLSLELKQVRHDIAVLVQPLGAQLLSSREAVADVGRESDLRARIPNGDYLAVVRANAKRAEESFRVLEEFARLPEVGSHFAVVDVERLRYATYDIEKRLAGCIMRKERAQSVRGLYVVVDREAAGTRPLDAIAREAIAGGASVIQLRDKTGSKSEVYRSAVLLNDICVENGVLFVMNDHMDVAAAVKAAAAHVGQDDLPLKVVRTLLPIDTIVGVSCRTEDDVRRAQEDGADYIAVGAVFPTTQKEDSAPLGLDFLKHVRGLIPGIPLCAIGGIGPGNIEDVVRAGADSIAVIGAVVMQPDVTTAARELSSKIREALQRSQGDEHETA
ncbi:MAG: thiamine phosphate synthase [Dehalococcoidia bacterium]|nr:thiamine phosphate synthase [Dehalococcoidia bacterium]